MSHVTEILEQGIEGRVFPGASFAFGTADTMQVGAVGHFGYGQPWPSVESATRYDVASLTKVVTTTAVAHSLWQQGLLDLKRRVSDFVPGLGDWPATFANLLHHDSGLPPYLESAWDLGGPAGVLEAVVSGPKGQVGEVVVYSCLGFVLLAAALERMAGQDLAALAEARVFGPLGMSDTGFRRADETSVEFPPTSRAEPWRRDCEGGFVQGIVHDPVAFALGGTSGNAGLFASAPDLGLFCQGVLRGLEEWQGWLPSVPGCRGLGWDAKDTVGSSAGNEFSALSFGHTGFTGTSLWIDPEQGVFSVLLSNSIHPDGPVAGIRGLRGSFNDSARLAMHGRCP